MTSPGGATRLRTALPTALLVGVTAVWGSTFFLIRDLVRTLAPQDFLAVRFGVAAVVMLAVFRRAVRSLDPRSWAVGLGLGVLYAVAQLLQTVGLAHTPASRSGFFTGLYVVLTPVLGAVLLRDRAGRATWLAVMLAVVGGTVLSLGSIGFGAGEALTVAAATVYALHIVALGRTASTQQATALATVQVVAVAVVSTVAALPGGVDTPVGPRGWASVLYMAVVAGAGAMWAQTWAQAHLPAARAAVVMTMEPVFAAAFAVVLGGEAVTWRMVVGGGLVVAAMYVSELG